MSGTGGQGDATSGAIRRLGERVGHRGPVVDATHARLWRRVRGGHPGLKRPYAESQEAFVEERNIVQHTPHARSTDPPE